MNKKKTEIILEIVIYAIVFLPFEIGLVCWLLGEINFGQVIFYGFLVYLLIALIVLICRYPFMALLYFLLSFNS